ncbi:MAG: oligopeptide/dipeptide ABC transporter ATP-binding protein [Candidatus Omnitrophota bacterium]
MLLSAEHLTKYYPLRASIFSRARACVRALEDVSFRLPEQHSLGVMGESGSGKTTLARLLANLIAPTRGTLSFSPAISDRTKDIQIISQNPWEALDPRMTIGQSLKEPLIIHRMNDIRDRLRRSLDLVGLDRHCLNRLPHEFSGGQRQRIVIARAMSCGPKILVCDEPTSSLDISVQAQILNLLLDLKEQQKLSLIFITHDARLLPVISDSILVLHSGIMVERGPREAVLNKPLHPYTRQLMTLSKLHEKPQAARGAGGAGCPFWQVCSLKKTECSEHLPEIVQISPEHWVRCCHFL